MYVHAYIHVYMHVLFVYIPEPQTMSQNFTANDPLLEELCLASFTCVFIPAKPLDL